MVTVSVRVAVAMFPEASVTCTVNGADVSLAVGIPVMTPLLERRRPTALKPVPEVTDHV